MPDSAKTLTTGLEIEMNDTRTTVAPRSVPHGSAFRQPVWVWLVFYMLVFVGLALLLHHAIHGVVNGWHAAISFFLAINTMICWWEISLGLHIGEIEHWHHDPAGQGERPEGTVFLARVGPRELLSTRLWARIWSEYAAYDPSYADRGSFGFAIDVGNGWTTLLPGLVFLVGMSSGIGSPVVLGLVGVVLFYQKLYGTCLYLFTFLFNRRWQGRPLGQVVAMVGGTNGIWIVFPAIGLYVSFRLILENDFRLIWT